MSPDDENQAEEQETPNPVGRPHTFRDNYIEQVFKLALLGLTDEEMANVIGISTTTFHRWKIEFPEFRDSIKRGKEDADADIVLSLRDRAKGYSHPETKVFCHEGKIITQEVTRHYPPDTGAIAFWLKNRQRRNWLESFDMTSAGEKVQAVVVSFSDHVAKQIAAGSPDVGVEQPEVPVAGDE